MKGKFKRIRKLNFILFIVILFTSTFTWTLVKVNATLPPTLIAPADGALINDSTPTAEWSLVVGATNYHIQISTVSDFDPLLEEDYTATNSYTPSEALPDGTYYWHVRAFDVSLDGWSVWTPTFNFTVDTTPPGIPVPNSPGNGEYLNDQTPDLDWNTVSGTYLYQIRIDDNSDMSSPLTDDITYTSDYTAALVQGTWYWNVRARDLVGNWGYWSDVWSFTIDTTAPDVIPQSDIDYTEGDKGHTITWSPNDDHPSFYIIYMDGIEILSGIWNSSSEIFVIVLDVLTVGSYNFTIYFEDATGNSGTDTVIVTVTPLIFEYNTISITLFTLISMVGLVILTIKRRK